MKRISESGEVMKFFKIISVLFVFIIMTFLINKYLLAREKDKIIDYGEKIEIRGKKINIVEKGSTDKPVIIIDPGYGFRVIIVIEANSYVNIKSSRLLPKFKTQKINSWCAA